MRLTTQLTNIVVYCCLLLFIGQSVNAQQYKLNWKKEVPIIGASIAMGIPSLVLKKNKPILTEAQIANLNRNSIWKFDRIATHNWRPKSAHASDALLYTAHAFPLLTLAHPDARKEWDVIGVMAIEAYVLNLGLTTLTKEIFQRKRPYVYNANAPLSKKQEADATSSFFSGHTSVAAVNSFFTASVLTRYTTNNKYDPLIWTTAALIPAVTAGLRVRAGKHFPTDVLVGYIVGAGVGLFIPWLHRRW